MGESGTVSNRRWSRDQVVEKREPDPLGKKHTFAEEGIIVIHNHLNPGSENTIFQARIPAAVNL
jgi:hypothetical protein